MIRAILGILIFLACAIPSAAAGPTDLVDRDDPCIRIGSVETCAVWHAGCTGYWLEIMGQHTCVGIYECDPETERVCDEQ